MPQRIVCTLPNASLSLDGIEWEPCKDGIVTKEPLDDEAADRLLTIEGFRPLRQAPAREKRADAGGAQPPTDDVPPAVVANDA
mgnify:CR=1 FL=1